jgi:methylase of polypeptide subunit release factors
MESRKLELDDGKELEIIQDLNYGYAGEVWDAALVFCHFLKNPKTREYFSFSGKTVIEIGSGTGICGLTLASVGYVKKIYLTDKSDKEVELLTKNYAHNKIIIPDVSEIILTPLNWAEKDDYIKNFSAAKEEGIDYILASEIIWNPDHFNDIQNLFDYLATKDKTTIFLAFQLRKKEDLEFLDSLKNNNWSVQRIPDKLLDEEYRSDDIFITIIKKGY